MLLSRKRGREVLAESPSNAVLHHHHRHRHIDEKWFLRDLLDATDNTQHEEQRARAQRQVVELLHRHNRVPEHAPTAMVSDARDNSLQMARARMSSQELFLSVVLEWQRADVGAQYAQPHEREPVYASRDTASSSDGRNGYYSSGSSSPCESSDSASASDASSDSELEDIQAVHGKKQRQLPGVEEVSPTSVHNVPRQLTPLNLDYIVSPSMKMIGIYSPRSRQELLRKYMTKRAKRLSQNKVRYRVRKTLANARPRVKGRFVKTEQPLTAAVAESMGGAPPSAHE